MRCFLLENNKYTRTLKIGEIITGFPFLVYLYHMNLQESIKKILKEYHSRDLEKEAGTSYKVIEKVLDKTMSKKYDWWKGIKISYILYGELSNSIEIYGKLRANKKWVKERWKEYRGYNLTDKNDYIRLDDIVDNLFLKELSDDIAQVLRVVTNYRDAKKTRLEWNEVIPV